MLGVGRVDEVLRGVVVRGDSLLSVSIFMFLELLNIKYICLYQKFLTFFLYLLKNRFLFGLFNGCANPYNIFE